ncbi:MAG: putative bifunctional diguanylate cyclase/phosphodiesterase [Labrys sp. (in: a-proteobacteria)]
MPDNRIRSDGEKRKGRRASAVSASEALAYELSHMDRLKTPAWIFDIDRSRVYWANKAALQVWRAKSMAELVARDMGADMSNSVALRLRQYQEDFIRSDVSFAELWTIYPEGQPVTLRVIYSGIRLPDGRMAMFCEGLVDAAKAPETLRSAEALLHTQMMISLYNEDGRPLYQNPAARGTVESFTGTLADRFADPADFDSLYRTLVKKGEAREVIRVRTTKGIRWHEITARACRDAVTGAPAFLTSEVDITDLKETESKAAFLAYHDVLTGLPNRTSVLREFPQMIDRARRAGESVGVLFIDLDRFKAINDTLGHSAGDEVLIEVAKRLERIVGSSGMVARLGGDEFLVVLQSKTNTRFEQVASAILSALGTSIDVKGRALVVSPSIGLSVYPDNGDTLDTLMKFADLAMYRAKEDGRNCFRYFSKNLQDQVYARVELESEILRAIRLEEFQLFYQPRLSTNTMRIVGAEALIRWVHPEKGLIPPSSFIPMCEETGLIEHVGEWVMMTAAAQQVQWRDRGFDLNMSVNLSPRQFRNGELAQKVADCLQATGCRPDALEFEITESMIMSKDDRVSSVIADLSALGVRLSIDDFGTGYSNLAMLQDFPVDCLKIDRSFISGLAKNRAIADMIVSLAKLMGMKIVAEGVETAEQLTWARAKGCHEFQGFFFSRPVTAEQFEQLLAASDNRRETA